MGHEHHVMISKDIQKPLPMVTDGLQLQKNPSSLEVAAGIDSCWHYSYMVAINWSDPHIKCWTSSQVTKFSTYFFQLIRSWEVDSSMSQDSENCSAYYAQLDIDCVLGY